jgi:hypothetical protein
MSSDTTGTLDGTIRIFGAPGVETSLTLPSRTPIKFLHFATNVFKLVCIGEYTIEVTLCGAFVYSLSYVLDPGLQTKMTSCTCGILQRMGKSSRKPVYALIAQ